MPACPNGARPKPANAFSTAIIDVAKLGVYILDYIYDKFPGALVNNVLGSMSVSHLCSLNPDDPGPLLPEYFFADMTSGMVPSFISPNGSLGQWIMRRAQYQAFLDNCECVQAGESAPPINTAPPPSGVPDYPPGNDNADILRRIEHNQSTSGDALTTIYNGLQLGVTDIRDLGVRLRASTVLPNSSLSFPMVGEGEYALPPQPAGTGTWIQDIYGIQVNLTVIPSTVARRGVNLQRLYGVGSVEWNVGQDTGRSGVIAQRDALHYERQFVLAPLHAQNFYVRWRLQPGVQAIGYQVLRGAEVAMYRPYDPNDGAYQPFDEWTPPSDWSDNPFYPRSSSRVFAVSGGALPP